MKVGDEADGGVPLVGDGRKRGRAVSETEGNDAARLGQSEAGLLRSIRGRWADLGFGPSGGKRGEMENRKLNWAVERGRPSRPSGQD